MRAWPCLFLKAAVWKSCLLFCFLVRVGEVGWLAHMHSADQGGRLIREFVFVKRVPLEELTEKRQRLVGSDDRSHVDIWGQAFSAEGRCLMCLRDSERSAESVSDAGERGWWGRASRSDGDTRLWKFLRRGAAWSDLMVLTENTSSVLRTDWESPGSEQGAQVDAGVAVAVWEKVDSERTLKGDLVADGLDR